jgi:hypothetical protein
MGKKKRKKNLTQKSTKKKRIHSRPGCLSDVWAQVWCRISLNSQSCPILSLTFVDNPLIRITQRDPNLVWRPPGRQPRLLRLLPELHAHHRHCRYHCHCHCHCLDWGLARREPQGHCAASPAQAGDGLLPRSAGGLERGPVNICTPYIC